MHVKTITSKSNAKNFHSIQPLLGKSSDKKSVCLKVSNYKEKSLRQDTSIMGRHSIYKIKQELYDSIMPNSLRTKKNVRENVQNKHIHKIRIRNRNVKRINIT